MSASYQQKRVVVTGGLGFIGSNLARRLESAGARVTVIDSCVEGCGGNPFHLRGTGVEIVESDIGAAGLEAVLREADVVFNLAGEVSHVHSMIYPERDAQLNAVAHLRFLNTLASVRRGVRVVYAGTRQIYGIPQALPVDESHPVTPVDFNGVHKYAADQYHALQARLGQLDAMVLRLTNVYGPGMAIGLRCQGFLPVFTARAVAGQTIEVFGDGAQLRDPLFVEDACEAFLAAGMVQKPARRVINIGSPWPVSLREIAAEFAAQAESPAPVLKPFPADRERIDIGSYFTCTGTACEVLGWGAKVALPEGVRRTLAYYREHQEHYVDRCCPLGHAATPAKAS